MEKILSTSTVPVMRKVMADPEKLTTGGIPPPKGVDQDHAPCGKAFGTRRPNVVLAEGFDYPAAGDTSRWVCHWCVSKHT